MPTAILDAPAAQADLTAAPRPPAFVPIDSAPDLPLLIGRLIINHHRGTRAGRPYLSVHFVCPFCREQHAHRWGETPARDYDSTLAIRRRAHCCEATRFAGRDYLLAPDPYHAMDNVRTIERANVEHARWRANRGLSERLAAERARERDAAKERGKWAWCGRNEPEGTVVGVRGGPPVDRLAGGIGRVDRQPR